jgi:hypothetical protein
METICFHPEAETEMIDAAVWYEAQQTTLGKRFITTVQDALNRIELNPVHRHPDYWKNRRLEPLKSA